MASRAGRPWRRTASTAPLAVVKSCGHCAVLPWWDASPKASARPSIEPPVVVWHGLSDVIVPPSHGHHQAARVQRGELRVRPGEGHFAGFSEVVDVLDRVREVWGDQTAEPATVSPTRRGRRKG